MIIDTMNHSITARPYVFSQNLRAIDHLTKLFDIIAMIIVITASDNHTLPSRASTDMVWLIASTSASHEITHNT